MCFYYPPCYLYFPNLFPPEILRVFGLHRLLRNHNVLVLSIIITSDEDDYENMRVTSNDCMACFIIFEWCACTVVFVLYLFFKPTQNYCVTFHIVC